MIKNLPQSFIQTIQKTFGDPGRQWLNGLDERLAQLEKRWGLHIDALVPNLSFNVVAQVTLSNGHQAILKCGVPGPANPDLQNEITALTHFDGQGAVRLLHSDAEAGCFLMEKLEPGQELVRLSDDDQATHIAAEIMQRLHRPMTGNRLRLPTVSDWFRGLEALYQQLSIQTHFFPQNLVDQAYRLGQRLIDSMEDQIVLHGDLHHFNILSAEREPWLAIDPKGVIGEPEYETGALLRNPIPKLVTQMQMKTVLRRRIDILTEILGFDPKRIHGWAFYQAILASWWAYSADSDDWRLFLACAQALKEMRL